MDEHDDNSGDPLALSRLDVISCGLGGAVLLGLVFSIVRHETPVNVSAAPFILVEWRVESTIKDVRPLINIVIHPPGADRPIDLPIEDFDLRTGLLKDFPSRIRTESIVFQNGDYQLSGFSRFGDESPLRTTLGEDVRDDNASVAPVFRLRIGDPAPGEWRIQARYQNNQNARELSDDQAKNTIRVHARAYSRESPDAVESSISDPISFGMVDSGVALTITPTAVVRQ